METTLPDGLVGYTGFVGGNLLAQRAPTLCFNRANSRTMRGQAFGRLWVSGAPAAKWIANREPDVDARNIDALIEDLDHTQAEEVVLISTVDVYPVPVDVDEEVAVAPDDHSEAYGRNRLRLERFVGERFPRACILRLPGLFGPGLKKNLLFDLLNARGEQFVHRHSVFQFYDLTLLAAHADIAVANGLEVVNLATEPIPATVVARDVFGLTLTAEEVPVANYDVHTRHARAFTPSVRGPYLMDAATVLGQIRNFVASAAR